jgi:hypothetical protein
MLSLVPRLHDLVGSSASRTMSQLRELGVDPSSRRVSVAVIVGRSPSPARRLLAETLVDMLLRLDPLIGEVIVDAPDMDLDALVSDLTVRLPLEVGKASARADYSIGVGAARRGADLAVDAAGWLAAIGCTAAAADDGNPIGPLAGAALTAAEVFKWAFAMMYPERARTLQLTPWSGVFSFFSYDVDGVSPPMTDVCIDTTLIGAGGVGAGFIRVVAALRERISGSLDLVDADILTTDNLNRVSYATLDGATRGFAKVVEAVAVLRRSCPHLAVTGHQSTFDAYKRRTPRREDRRYDVVVTGLDSDDIRWDVQRDLPRILIDGATGRDMIARVERVEFGRYGCVGCSRPPVLAAPDRPGNCDAPPDAHAPSLSFLSAFPGILAAGEVIKESAGIGALRGRFDHVFRYGPNPDMVRTPGFRDGCVVGCGRPSKIAQYLRKYPSERSTPTN